jgi:hypothetical protein
MRPMHEAPTPWRRLGETLEGSFVARADSSPLSNEGEEIGRLEIHALRRKAYLTGTKKS